MDDHVRRRLLLAEGKAVQKKLDAVRALCGLTSIPLPVQGEGMDDQGLAVYDKLVALRQRTQARLGMMKVLAGGARS